MMGVKSSAPAAAFVVAVVLAVSSCGDDAAPSGAPPGPDGGQNPGPDASAPPKPQPEAGTDGGATLDAFGAWEQIRAALAASPDQRLARADELVATKDPQGIFRFVRDEIATYPPSDSSFEGAVTAQRWGVRGTLRGGAGTPREKVELLIWLYKRAGIQAEAVVGTPDPAFLDGQKVLLRDLAPRFSLAATTQKRAEWRAALGHDEVPSRPLIDPGGTRAKELATSLLGLLPGSATSPFDFTLGQIPLVRLRAGTATRYANPIAPTVAYDASLTVERDLELAPEAAPPPAITVTLEGVRANAPFERFTLVEGQFAGEDVVGRKLHLSFVPPVKTEDLASTRIDSVTTFAPLLSVAGPDTTLEERDRLARMGNPVSLGGDVYTFAESGDVTVNGVPLPAASSDPGAATRVASVEASVDAATFPDVTLRIQAAEGDGDAVPRLPASAFDVSEQDADVSFTIVQNQAPPPRIALLFDTSTSIPDSFRGASAATLGKDIAAQLFAKYPGAELRAGTVWFGANWFDGTWAKTVAEANTQIDAVVTAPGGSEIWAALAEAAKEKPTLIIIVTDAVPSEPVTAFDRTDIADGPPILALGVGTVDQDTLGDIARTSGGTALAVANPTAAVSAAEQAIESQSHGDYVLRYRAPAEGPSPRTVSVTINGKTVEVSYDVPTAEITPSALAGLYLTVKVGDRSATRAVAGLALASSTARPEASEGVLADVRSLLRGRISFDIEGAAPSPSIVLSDWISEKLSLRPLFSALEDRDDAAVIAALKEGIVVTPSALPIIQAPLPGAWSKEALTFETGPRITSLVQKVNLGGPVTNGLDIWPLSRWSTAATDDRVAFERTLEATSSLAVLESELLKSRSTLKSLSGVTLTAVPAGQARDQAGLSDEERRAWAFLEEPFIGRYTLLVPEKPGPFWAVDDGTGTVIGVLQDGSGGSGDDACSAYNEANSMITALGMIGSLAGASVGGWAALAKWEVKYITVATIVIGGGSLPPGAGDLHNPAADMGCGMADDVIGNAFPAITAYEAIHDAYEASGADTAAPTFCGAFDSNLCH